MELINSRVTVLRLHLEFRPSLCGPSDRQTHEMFSAGSINVRAGVHERSQPRALTNQNFVEFWNFVGSPVLANVLV